MPRVRGFSPLPFPDRVTLDATQRRAEAAESAAAEAKILATREPEQLVTLWGIAAKRLRKPTRTKKSKYKRQAI